MSYFDYSNAPRPLVLAVIIGAVLMLSAMTSSKEVMNPEIKSKGASEHPIPIALTVRGASAGIQPAYFEQALVDEIVANNLFSDLGTDSNKPFLLNIRIIRVEAPSFALNMTVDMNAVWELSHESNGRILTEKIHSTYTGGVFEGGIIGANRVRVAAEGAARANIRAGLEMIALLDLKG